MKKVLIVEDEILARLGLRQLVDWRKLELELLPDATDGEEALKMIRNSCPDIILLDLNIPKVSGLEILEFLKKEEMPTKVIVVSCQEEFDVVKKAMKLGAYDYLRKLNLSSDELENILEKCLVETEERITVHMQGIREIRYEGCDADLDSLIGADNATLTLYTASGLGKVEIRQSAGAGRQKLEAKITSAETLWNSKTVGNRPGQVPKTEYDALKAAIDSAKSIVAKANATTEEINNEIEVLQTAVYDFTVAIVPPTDFTELNAKIVEAKALKEKTGVGIDIGKAPQSAHDTFQIAISNAEIVAGTTDALQAEVDDALTELEASMKAFISKIVLSSDTLPFDFVGDAGTGFDVPGVANKTGEETNINLPATGSVAYTQVTGTNLEFSFKIAPEETFEWLGMNLSNSGMSMLGSGNGLSTLFWKAQGAVTSRVVEEQPGKGWDAAGATKQIHDGGLLEEGKSFNDGEWHKVTLKKTADGWQFTIDGINVIANRYEGFDDDMDRLLGGSNTVTMTLFTNGTAGTFDVLQESVDVGLNVTALNKLIEDAEKALTDAQDDRIPQSAKDAVKKAVDEAKAVISE